MSKSAVRDSSPTFQLALRRALDHAADPAWLLAESPLATPYFLGTLAPATNTPDGLAYGRTLQRLLHETADSIWAGSPPPTKAALVSAVDEARVAQGNAGDEYAYFLLELRYFRHYFSPDDYPVESADIPVYLALSSTRFFVHLQRAIDRLGELLLRRVQPALRLEQPPLPSTFVGREREQREVTAALTARSSVSLTGPPGAGKTTLGTVIGHAWPGERVFWYTFLPGLNDSLGALLFALAHFDHAHGQSALWSYLLTHSGEAIDAAQATGLLRADLIGMGEPTPLLIIDEVDLLRTADGEARSTAHSQLLFFLEALVGMVPLLLIGQRAYVDTPVHLSLPSLDADGVAALLDAAGTHLPRSQAQRVHSVTGGLPRLVWLVVALLRSGEDVDEITRMHLRGDATPLFHRLWRRLDLAEKELLVALSAFRRAAPGDVWTRHQAACDSLYERRLLLVGENSEISLHSFFQRLIYQELRPEQREKFHQQAGRVRGERGEYTAAAYHFAQANEPELAVGVWFPHRELEINRGQAGAALEIFSTISSRGLSTGSNRQLKVIQNQLYLLSGQPSRVSENVRSITWDMDDALTAEAFAQAARSEFAGGNIDGALNYDAQSIEVLARNVSNMIDRHLHRGSILLDQGDIQSARVEALLSEQRRLMLDGLINYIGNEYELSLASYEKAKAIAESGHRLDLVAETNRRIAEIHSMFGRVAQAEEAIAAAIAYYDNVGDRQRSEWLRVVLGNVYVNSRRFSDALPPTLRAVEFLEASGMTEHLTQPYSQLAEAYLETGEMERAIEYAYRVINAETPLYRPYAFYTLGLAQQRLGKADVAAAAFAEGLASAQRNSDRFIEAYLHRNVGRLRREQGDETAARQSLTAALELFRAMKIPHEIAETEGEIIN